MRRGTRIRIVVIIISVCATSALLWYIIEFRARHLIWAAALAGAPAFYAILSPFLELAQWMLWPRGVVRADSRGVKATMMELGNLEPPLTLEERSVLRAWQRNRPFPWGILLGFIGGFLTIWVTIRLTKHFLPPRVLGVPPTFILLPIVSVAVIRIVRVRFIGYSTQALLAVGRCASCGHTISYQTAEADGCVVCPECGAAWER